MLWFGVALTWTALWALPAIALLILFLLGFALFLSALQVRYRDVGLAMPVLLQVWLFATPVSIRSTPSGPPCRRRSTRST